MKKYFSFSLLRLIALLQFILLTGIILAQPPAGYYNGTQGLTGEPLRAKLHDIIKGHTSVSYSSIYTYFQSTDKKPNNTVWDMYSDVPGGNPPYVYYYNQDECGSYNSEGDCFNREHSWPSSWFNDNMPMRTDLFHIYPTDGYVNNRRSNYPYGEVNNPTWTSMNGSKLGPCSYPGYSGTAFEPIDEYKGDFARTYFYMCTRYYKEDQGWQSNAMVNGANLSDWAVQMLLEWHHNDPVSTKETDRNNAVYAIQHNRNPFIDEPLFADRIWGGATAIQEISTATYAWPLPFSDQLNVTVSTTGDPELTIWITDITGRVVIEAHGEAHETTPLNTSLLKPGLYILKTNASPAIKIIKQ